MVAHPHGERLLTCRHLTRDDSGKRPLPVHLRIILDEKNLVMLDEKNLVMLDEKNLVGTC